jgi:hypothetical protein
MKDRQLHVELPCETYERLKLMAIMKGRSIKKIAIDLSLRPESANTRACSHASVAGSRRRTTHDDERTQRVGTF